MGGGVHFQDVQIDYAYIPFGNLGDQHRITLGVEFGGPAKETQAAVPVRTRRPRSNRDARYIDPGKDFRIEKNLAEAKRLLKEKDLTRPGGTWSTPCSSI